MCKDKTNSTYKYRYIILPFKPIVPISFSHPKRTCERYFLIQMTCATRLSLMIQHMQSENDLSLAIITPIFPKKIFLW